MFSLPELPYPKNALVPHLSAETLEYHHGKHHRAYVEKLNTLVKGSPFENATLEDIIRRAEGAIFNNAAQTWNHTFFWNCMTPGARQGPGGTLAAAIDKHFASLDKFREEFSTAGVNLFGSGWVWLVRGPDGSLRIAAGGNAWNPLQAGDTPLLTCDVWEHAYYIDYRNARPKYIEAFWKLVNWPYVEQKFGA